MLSEGPHLKSRWAVRDADTNGCLVSAMSWHKHTHGRQPCLLLAEVMGKASDRKRGVNESDHPKPVFTLTSALTLCT